jgi:3-phenylpropionate/trans-cinnamate dioxygenase ferredoxin subunit
MTRYRVARADELDDGELRQVKAGATKICLVRDVGIFLALDDECPHEQASLSEGEIYDGSVQCPLHGSLFDLRDGSVTGLPAVSPATVYHVDVEEGDVWVTVDDSLVSRLEAGGSS